MALDGDSRRLQVGTVVYLAEVSAGLRAELLECRLAVSGVGPDDKIGHLCFIRYCLQVATERVVGN